MKKYFCYVICLALFLSGYVSLTGKSFLAGSSEKAISTATPSSYIPSTAEDSERRDSIQRPEIGDNVVIDPPYDYDPSEMLPKDFGNHFLNNYPTEITHYKIGEGTDIENEVTVLKGAEDGPTVYIVAGVHGDEQAAWEAGNLLKKISLQAGTLHILSPANRWGSNAEPRSRYIVEKEDLNRAFPGDMEGNTAQRAAYTIYQDIEQTSPIFLLDLHEARVNKEGYDFLGSSLIYTSLENMSDLYLSLLLATENGEVGSERFNFYAPGPIGSLNNTVSTNLDIPAITVETYRGYPLERRIGDQLDIVEYILTYYGMV